MMNEVILAENAIAWAKAHVGSKEYQLKCLGFIEDSLEKSNGIEIFGGDSAKESAALYAAHENTGLPPKGTFVFYGCVGVVGDKLADWGHCGLSLGNGEVIHAWNVVRIDNYLEVERLPAAPGWSQPKYIGWVPLERILVGYQKKNY
ncbi:NlpC/P60 family protein [Anaerocolumna xylanovorans]|uniref:NlpC/P60 family protein n=1 Tax=Anaerocolumna xylanovorans DSM 12503 TaxID=1121345 RepID=A0A1M7YG96_9FIRM|nr:NlpC/P60 family protein [Anaerocolumna xylanovorans]SHO51611.1 NlpC/P60 family protein [Anaerocolumna xylanovorans DSM 12503]